MSTTNWAPWWGSNPVANTSIEACQLLEPRRYWCVSVSVSSSSPPSSASGSARPWWLCLWVQQVTDVLPMKWCGRGSHVTQPAAAPTRVCSTTQSLLHVDDLHTRPNEKVACARHVCGTLFLFSHMVAMHPCLSVILKQRRRVDPTQLGLKLCRGFSLDGASVLSSFSSSFCNALVLCSISASVQFRTTMLRPCKICPASSAAMVLSLSSLSRKASFQWLLRGKLCCRCESHLQSTVLLLSKLLGGQGGRHQQLASHSTPGLCDPNRVSQWISVFLRFLSAPILALATSEVCKHGSQKSATLHS